MGIRRETHSDQRALILTLLASILSTVYCAFLLLRIPADSKNAFLFGLSKERLLMLSGFAVFFLFFIILLFLRDKAADILRKKGVDIPKQAVIGALSHISWPVRMELVHHDPDVYIDGGHNPQCIAAAEEFFMEPQFAGRTIHVLTGMLGDKDYRTMAGILKRFTDDAYFFRFL